MSLHHSIAITVCNTLLLVGAVGCVFAPSIFWLLISRFVQGIGVSTSVVVFAIVADSYKGDEAVKFIGIMNSVLTVVMAITLPTMLQKT